MSARWRLVLAAAAVPFAAIALAGPASAASIVVTPGSTTPGGTVNVTGDVLAGGTPACTVPGSATLISNAFVGLGEFAGVGAAMVPVDATGHFSAALKLSSSVAPGTYQVTGRCGGGNLGVTATLTITGLAPTGPSLAGRDPARVAAGALAAGAAGGALVAVSRRRRPA